MAEVAAERERASGVCRTIRAQRYVSNAAVAGRNSNGEITARARLMHRRNRGGGFDDPARTA